MKENNDESKQVRMTLEDTLRYQDELSNLIKLLATENRPVINTERKRLKELMAKALLSQGAVDCESMVIEGGFFTFASLQNLILRLSDINEKLVRLTTHKPEVNIQTGSIGEIWRFIYDRMLYYFPLANAEAMRYSKESQFKTKQEAYEFDSEGGI